MATELISGETVSHGGDVSGHTGLRGWAQSNKRATGNLTVDSLPAIGHRRLLNDEAVRRSLQSHDAGMLEGVIEKDKRCLSTGDSP